MTINLTNEILKVLNNKTADDQMKKFEDWTELLNGVISIINKHVEDEEAKESLHSWTEMTGEYLRDLTISSVNVRHLLTKSLTVIDVKNKKIELVEKRCQKE